MIALPETVKIRDDANEAADLKRMTGLASAFTITRCRHQ